MSKSFSASNKMIVCFCHSICLYGRLHLLLFSYMVLQLWDKAYLITVVHLFDVVSDLVCNYFIEYFCIYVQKGKSSVILGSWVFM